MVKQKCLNCSGPVNEGYKYCESCYNQYKAEQKHHGEQQKEGAVHKKIIEKDAVVDHLQKINNNIYRTTRQLDLLTKHCTGLTIVWDKKKKDFVQKKGSNA